MANYKDKVGRLATDRFDFEDHIEGNKFRHKAKSVDLSPITIVQSNSQISVDGYNVQSAIQTLFDVVSPSLVNEATATTSGLIKLSGDISASPNANNIVVSGIRSYAISPIVPTDGDVLTFQNSQWTPLSANNNYTAAGDLVGTNTLQSVVSLTGDTFPGAVNGTNNTVHVNGSIVAFSSVYGVNINPTVTVDPIAGAAKSLVVMGQTSTSTNTNGGNVIITGGASGGGTGLKGGVKLRVTNTYSSANTFTSSNLLEVTEVSQGRRVLSLFGSTNLTSTEMPTGTGDMVMYVKNSPAPPTNGNPVNGAIVYALNGELRVRQADSADFVVGSIPNPSIWGQIASDSGQAYTQKFSVKSIGTAYVTLPYTLNLTDKTTTKIDMLVLGKRVNSNSSAQYNVSMGYSYDGTVAALGSITTSDPRYTSGGSPAPNTWTAPTISLSGTTVSFRTGAATGIDINWFVVLQITTSQVG